MVFADGGYWCRQCENKGWWGERPTKEEVQKKQQEEHERKAQLVERMHGCNAWIHYHDHPKALESWQLSGVLPPYFDKWGVGYCDECPLYPESPSLTIPVFYKGRLYDIRHRILQPNGSGKYRSHLAGLTPPFFNLDSVAGAETVYVVEGEKKAIVLSTLDLKSVVSVPGLSFFARLPNVLNRLTVPSQHIVFIPDPGCIREVTQCAAQLKVHHCSIVDLWEKPDDFLLKYGREAFFDAIRYVRPA